MGDLALPLVLTALVLVYASFLVYIRLASAGVSRGDVTRTIIEVWVTFAVIVALLLLVRAWTGAGEFATRLEAFGRLPLWQQVGLIALLLAALGLFIHLLRRIRSFDATPTPVIEEHHD